MSVPEEKGKAKLLYYSQAKVLARISRSCRDTDFTLEIDSRTKVIHICYERIFFRTSSIIFVPRLFTWRSPLQIELNEP